jgi:hypothetical protein
MQKREDALVSQGMPLVDVVKFNNELVFVTFTLMCICAGEMYKRVMTQLLRGRSIIGYTLL